MNSVMWGLTKRGKKKTKNEIAKWDKEVATGEREPFYDYYDTNEYFVNPDEEVGITGLSLSTRVAWEPGMKGREYEYLRVSPGNYRIVIKIYDTDYERNALILEDIWYDQ